MSEDGMTKVQKATEALRELKDLCEPPGNMSWVEFEQVSGRERADLVSARSATLRNMLISWPDVNLRSDTDDDCPEDDARRIAELLDRVWESEFHRDQLSELAMELSLCPLHFIDWAICFDDANPECSQIREIFPYSHDT